MCDFLGREEDIHTPKGLSLYGVRGRPAVQVRRGRLVPDRGVGGGVLRGVPGNPKRARTLARIGLAPDVDGRGRAPSVRGPRNARPAGGGRGVGVASQLGGALRNGVQRLPPARVPVVGESAALPCRSARGGGDGVLLRRRPARRADLRGGGNLLPVRRREVALPHRLQGGQARWVHGPFVVVGCATPTFEPRSTSRREERDTEACAGSGHRRRRGGGRSLRSNARRKKQGGRSIRARRGKDGCVHLPAPSLTSSPPHA